MKSTCKENLNEFFIKFASFVALGILCAIVLYPFVWTLISSVKDTWLILKDPIGLPRKPTFANYIVAWTIGEFSTYFFNSTVITVCSVIGIALLSATAGYGFARFRFKGSDTIFLLFIMSLVVVSPSIMIAEFLLFRSLRLLNSYLGIILVYMSGTAFAIVMLRSAFKEIPQELVDAARIDGCGEFGAFFRVALPLVRPTVATVTIFCFVGIWNDFVWPLILLQKAHQLTITVGLMTYQGEYMVEWGPLTAGLSMGFLPVLTIYYIFQRHFVRALTLGALKG